MESALPALVLGFLLGMRHATDADHLVAVTTMVSQQHSLRASSLIGAVWGLGHTITIVVVGGAIILFGIVIPPRLGLVLEFSVGGMLVALGVMSLIARPHEHDRKLCEDLHVHEEPPPARRVARSLIVGVVHGLAGSGAVALLVLTTIPEPVRALVYLIFFGGGTVVGMMAMTSLIALPFAFAGARLAHVNRALVRITSVVSIALGLWTVYETGIEDGLFSSTPHWTPR